MPTSPRHPRRAAPVWQQAASATSDPARSRRNFARLLSAHTNPELVKKTLAASPEFCRQLAILFAAAQSLSDTLVAHPDYFEWLQHSDLRSAPTASQLKSQLNTAVETASSTPEKYNAIRRFKRREQLRIGLRDLAGLASLEETTLAISDLADACLDTVYRAALETLTRKLGTPIADNAPTLTRSDAPHAPQTATFSILGMGKLGGRELNYSSDVDVIFVYSHDGRVHSNEGKTTALTNEEFFTRLAESIIAAVGNVTDAGSIYRIDLRLRPEGATGPLVRSLESCEYYYAALGETWERLALLKARPLAGDEKLGSDFLQMVEPFVFRRYGGEGLLRDMAVIKSRIEREVVKANALTRHVKLGIGGIREIEFILQALQVLHGGHDRQLRNANTLEGLGLMRRAKILPAKDANALADAYRFLRNIEHRLQMEADVQTHTIPDEKTALRHLARLMGFKTVAAFQKIQTAHTGRVRRIYHRLLASAPAPAVAPLAPQQTVGDSNLGDDEAFLRAVERAGFADAAAAAKFLASLAYGQGFVHVSAQTSERFLKLIPKILSQARMLAEPDAALQQFERFVERYGSRGALYDTFNTNPRLLELLLKLFDNSRFLGETFLRAPELFDDVMRGSALAQSKDIQTMLDELRGETLPQNFWDAACATARRYKQQEWARIALADILGLADLEWTQAEFSFLAEALLKFGLEIAARPLPSEHVPLAVIALGKFGGQELGYGADLDVLFVCGDAAGAQDHATLLAKRLTELMSRQTADGVVFKLDARLRPDGEQGPLVPTLSACRQYYQSRAWLWEKQSLTKARFVAGDAETGREFMRLVNETIYARPLTAEEAGEIVAMRRRIEQERSDAARPELSFKTASGGMMDVEFLVQALQMRHGHRVEALRCTPTLAALGRLTARGLIEESDNYTLRHDYLFLRHLEFTLRRYENAPISELPRDEAEQQKLAKRLAFANTKEFWNTYTAVRERVRKVYEKLLR